MQELCYYNFGDFLHRASEIETQIQTIAAIRNRGEQYGATFMYDTSYYYDVYIPEYHILSKVNNIVEHMTNFDLQETLDLTKVICEKMQCLLDTIEEASVEMINSLSTDMKFALVCLHDLDRRIRLVHA